MHCPAFCKCRCTWLSPSDLDKNIIKADGHRLALKAHMVLRRDVAYINHTRMDRQKVPML